MNREIAEMNKAYSKYEDKFAILQDLIVPLCDFEAYLTFCAGDGHLVGNDANHSVAPLSCLKGITKDNKLTEEEHLKYCI